MRPSVFGLSNAGWHNVVGLELAEDYNTTKLDIKRLISHGYDSFPEFVDAFYEPILQHYSTDFWVEKTPSNAFTLELFLDRFPQGKAIHIVREPLDVIASLHNRGMSLYNAVSVSLLNMSVAYSISSDRLLLVKYEELVSEPMETLSSICQFISIDFERGMLEQSRGEGGVSRMDGWNYDERAKAQKGSIGRFQLLKKELKEEILGRIALHKHNLDTSCHSIPELRSAIYSRDTDIVEVDGLLSRMTKEREEDIKKRYFTSAYFRRSNYPIVIGDE